MSLRPGERYQLLYDGHCVMCTKGAKKLQSLAKKGAVELVDFQKPGALDDFPTLTHDRCMEQMVLVTPEGKAIGGLEGAALAFATRPWIGKLAFLYFLPVIRQILDALYRWVARNRYRFMGKNHECEDGACELHFGAKLSIGAKKDAGDNDLSPAQREEY